jgi:hypothetical protein
LVRWKYVRYLIPFFLPILAFGSWSEVKSGPFEVLTDAGAKESRTTLNYLEQLRNALGHALGQQDLPSVWPIRIVVLKSKRQTQPTLKFARDAWVCSIDQITPQTAASVVDVLIGSWPGHVPPNIRRGLVTLYSTLDVDATHVTLGNVPANKDRDWARAHMLAVQPEFSGRLRVLLSNLGKGIDSDVAYKNAFEKSSEQIEQALNKYIEAGQYGTIGVSGKPVNAQRQFIPKELDDKTGALAIADIAYANGSDPGYDKLNNPDGQGFVALRKGDRDKARTLLAQSSGAYALVEYAKLLPESDRKPVLEKAAAANPRWAVPYKLIAAIETHPAQKLSALRKATQLDPNDADSWTQLAQTQERAKQMAEAAKSWAAAERATDDPEERERVHQFRAAGERARAEAEMTARDEARRKTEQEMQDLKNRALMEIRKAEAKANAGKPVIDANTLEEYKEKPASKKASGVLTRVDCQGTQAILHVQSGRSVIKLLVADPSTVAIGGGGERSLTCGVQKPARKVEVEFEPEGIKKVIRIDFR